MIKVSWVKPNLTLAKQKFEELEHKHRRICIFRELKAIARIQFRLRQDDAEALYASIDSTE
jgi:hypothetical protein